MTSPSAFPKWPHRVATRALPILIGIGCQSSNEPSSALRAEFEQALQRLRDDSTREIELNKDKLLSTQAQLIKTARELSALGLRSEQERAITSERIAALENAVDLLRAELTLAATPVIVAPPPSTPPEDDALLRAYEELVCAERRTGASLDAEALTALERRWGFETSEQWAAAWVEASLEAAFEGRARDRIERLCPLPAAPPEGP
ncbi:MAG: hypothetical protein IV100_13665 [Myxococcales bacterium]|nr:hypothetical protein [Myxococcales bacterium]